MKLDLLPANQLALFLQGKRLLRSELPFSHVAIEMAMKRGAIKQSDALVTKNGRLYCVRCNNQEQSLFGAHRCARCGKWCKYCRHCIKLGKISSCQTLLTWQGEANTSSAQAHSLSWKGELSAQQKRASAAVVQAVEQKSSLLVWAVCGSGKTEIIFRGLEQAFAKGFRVLLATPRTDVVKELTLRLKRAFPEAAITSLYSGSNQRDISSVLVIATTHQVMRYYQAFDLVIVDEVDAFPFSYDQSLEYAVSMAKKQNAALIYLSATPGRTLRVSKQLEIVKIPRRFHGKPLPVPCFRWCGNWRKAAQKGRMSSAVIRWLENHRQPVFLFVPTVRALKRVSEILTQKQIEHRAVHANALDRHEAVAAFRKGACQLLITTTILERGVTISNLAVAVLGAEDDVFDESALVQIAGRAGRDPHAPDGEVVFFHYGKTIAMKAARRQIMRMNREGGVG